MSTDAMQQITIRPSNSSSVTSVALTNSPSHVRTSTRLIPILLLIFVISIPFSYVNAENYGLIKSPPLDSDNLQKYPIIHSFLSTSTNGDGDPDSDTDTGIAQYSHNIGVQFNPRHKKVTLTIYLDGKHGQVLDTIILNHYRSADELHKTLNDRGFKRQTTEVEEEAMQEELEKMINVINNVHAKHSAKYGEDGKGGVGDEEKEVHNLIMEMNKVKMEKEEKFDPSSLSSMDSIMEGL